MPSYETVPSYETMPAKGRPKARRRPAEATKFEEIQVLGNAKTLHIFEAKILPDRNYISDLTFNYKKFWAICKESEFEKLKKAILIKK